MYLTLMDYGKDLRTNLLENHLSKSSILYSEPEFLLRTELRNPSRYMSILEAIATGHTTPNEISGKTGVDPGPLSTYLNRLRRLRLVGREVPVTAHQKKSKRSTYRIRDEFLRFWFRFVEPNRSGIEEAPEMVLDNRILPGLDAHASSTFEDVCREAVWALARSDALNGSYGSVGRWWHGEDEVDVAALDDGTPSLLLGECKWTNDPVGFDVAEDLEEKAQSVRWKEGTRREEFVLFSRAGYVDGLRESLDERWSLYDLDHLEGVLRKGRVPSGEP